MAGQCHYCEHPQSGTCRICDAPICELHSSRDAPGVCTECESGRGVA